MATRQPTPDLVGGINVLDDIFGTKPANTPEKISLWKIQRDGGTQMRAGLDEATVTEYFEAMHTAGAWGSFPPLTVFYDGAGYWLADGFHRYAAAMQEFGASLQAPCDIRAGTQRDAMLHAASANASHGLRRTNADKRRAVLALLQDPEWSQWSDGEIAKRCAVSQPFVSGLRHAFAPERNVTIVRLPDSPDEDDEDATTHNGYESPAPATATRKGSDGRDYTMPNYAAVWELAGAIKSIDCSAVQLRAAAKDGNEHWVWGRARDAVDSKSLRWRKADLVQAINNVASQREQSEALAASQAKVDEGVAQIKAAQEIKYLSDVEAIIVGWHANSERVVFGEDDGLTALIVIECANRGFQISRHMAFQALQNARNLIVADKRNAARAAAPAPAPVSLENGKNLVDWTEEDWSEAEAKIAPTPEVAAKNAKRREDAVDLIELYKLVILRENDYTAATGDHMGPLTVVEGLRKMISGLERLVADLA
jgi:hypothetical protein